MTGENVLELVIDAVRQVQESSGRTAVGIGPDTRPFRDVEGFDSLSGVEATAILSGLLGRELPDSAFVPRGDNRNITLSEVAENARSHIG